MANLRVFIDSNILIYTDDKRFPEKQQIANNLVDFHLRRRSGVISIQVLQEYYSVTTSKLRIDPVVAREKVEILSSLYVFQPTTDDILGAIDIHRLHQFSFWDGLILRSSIQSGCRILLSEDLQHGRRIEGIEITNPFV